MRFLDVYVEQFGVLNNVELRDLSPGLTVVYGGNGTGKTTLVHFLRGLLFGYSAEHQAFHADDGRFGGAVSLESRGRSLRLTRERSHGIATELSTVDLATGMPVTVHNGDLPEWANETTYCEVFSVGEHEAVRFDLLSRLCLDDVSVSMGPEIHRAEMAVRRAVQEREGIGSETGLRHRKADLQGRREELMEKLAEIRRFPPEVPQQISRTESELRQLRVSAEELHPRIQGVTCEVRRLERLLGELPQQNTVALNRQPIEDQISELVARTQRWADIRSGIQREVSQLTTTCAAAPAHGSDTMESIHAIIARLEERMGVSEVDIFDGGINPDGVDREIITGHIRSEVFSLCEYMTRHASAVAFQQVSLETSRGQKMLQDIDQVTAAIQAQIDALSQELNRSANVLLVSEQHGSSCESAAHSVFRSTASDQASCTSGIDLEAELSRQKLLLDEFDREESRISNEISRHENRLTELQMLLRSSGCLEDLDRIKGQIAETDARLHLLNDRWRVLEQTETSLRTVIDRLGQYRDSDVLEVASGYIDRLTEGACYRLAVDVSGTAIVAATRQSTGHQTLQQLSRGTRDLVALALRLALVQYRAEDSERAPLLIDDVFIMTDDDRASAVVDLLMDVAADGQQIIFLTCQREVRDLFAQKNAAVRHLEQRETSIAAIAVEPPAPLTTNVKSAVVEMAAPRQQTNWLFYLEVDSSVEDLSGLTIAEIEAIRAAGINSIDELLSMSVTEQQARFRDRGYSISTDRIRSWRGQAELATEIPMLRRSDAELLYASGIQSTVELSRMRPEAVFDVVAAFQNSQAGARFRRSGRTLDRQQAISWCRWSQHSRSLSDARRTRSRFFVSSSDFGGGQPLGTISDGTPRLRQRRPSLSGGQATTRRQRRPGLSTDARRLRDQRQQRRRQRLTRHSASYRTAQAEVHDEETGKREQTFYLNRSADVDAAPSIGPRTAQRLATVGIYTVDDLLNATAESLAERLANRRVSGDTILQWQSQARLVCMVPGLRGLSAQILVACGINEVEQLSQKRPVDLLALVGPFSETSEGKRIIRGAKKPNLDEITDWICWAQQSRTLKAAA
ncbi:MAG: DUF4332 domain-containing protein [Fuerstiella sp.]|nr:DUF4332 domain-containing protein [Fuerstiella sp.]MCP4856688.1 DUF4332 domain-containing protein [Fuerstiella sp.]